MRLAKIKQNEELLDRFMFECVVLAIEHALSANETVQVSLSSLSLLSLFSLFRSCSLSLSLSLSLCMYMYAFVSSTFAPRSKGLPMAVSTQIHARRTSFSLLVGTGLSAFCVWATAGWFFFRHGQEKMRQQKTYMKRMSEASSTKQGS